MKEDEQTYWRWLWKKIKNTKGNTFKIQTFGLIFIFIVEIICLIIAIHFDSGIAFAFILILAIIAIILWGVYCYYNKNIKKIWR